MTSLNVPNEVLRSLIDHFPESSLLISKEDLIPYSFDATATFYHAPLAVLFPSSIEDILWVLKWAKSNHACILPRGSGTSLSGAAVPQKNSIVLSMTKWNKILETDPDNLTLLVEPGITTQVVQEEAAKYSLFYPPDPGSYKISTIGGNVGHNSGGIRGLKYGVTRNYVLGMEVVLPNGQVVWLGNKCVKDSAGYSLKDLFIGSEGTLGIVTKVLLRLIPKPQERQVILASFPTLEAASEATSAIIKAALIPSALEFLDQKTIECIEAYSPAGFPKESQAVLLIESDGHPQAVRDEITRINQVLKQYGPLEIKIAEDPKQQEQLWSARKVAFSALARKAPTVLLEDVTVPRSSLVQMIRKIQQISKTYAVEIAVYAHMGDGNLHPVFLGDESNKDLMEKVFRAMKEIFLYAIKLGGTITGEHGVGLAKKEFLAYQYKSEEFQLLKSIKKILDPENLLNPGKIFD
ncbi:FAD-binding protein [Methylacidiphilum kamchatkense Kam1]|uniref:FAD-binding protein n=1 Tax=Methylacidiphilum kamchatkense Kam1 TaxID=1202785 RepID=A0A0C1UUH1_9BACT|nr:FAD-linked oxidase C-terminal domain-containing protein [Methylacidiphilum kamchatkense]KIE59423.1 FAD-binding protein [Methylacidiphilum kamchatkense Kam1]QDQ42590.1 glycolate oxidase [Methylacidiphilum kamchatkense Kam1]